MKITAPKQHGDLEKAVYMCERKWVSEWVGDSGRDFDDEWVTLPKELHVPPVRLDGEAELGPAVFVCVCVFVSVCALKRCTYSRICEHSSYV